MFNKDKKAMGRRELALFFLEKFREYVIPPGVPLNEQTFTLVSRNVLLMADSYLEAESLPRDALVALGQPQMQPQARPNNGAPVAQFPPQASPKAS